MQKFLKLPTLANQVFNLKAPCQEQELIRWKSVVEDNFKINKTPDENKAAFIRGRLVILGRLQSHSQISEQS